MRNKNIAVLTSGGDAPGMNAAIRAVVRTGIFNGLKVLGVRKGYEGLIKGEIFEMSLSSVADIIHRGGTILQTARSYEFTTPEGKEKALNMMEVFGIQGLVIIGGDGSFRGARDLADMGAQMVGVPGTIDNDIPYCDYTIGFDTAVNTVVEAIGRIRDTTSSHNRANIIEVMGRNSGDISLYAGLAGGAESIIIPEVNANVEDVCKRIMHGRNRGKLHSIIILAEGVGGAFEMAKAIEEKISVETRVTILGHVQRGGSPSAFDRILASRLGAKAVELLMEGETSKMTAQYRSEIRAFDFDEVLSAKKEFSSEIYSLARILSI
ncbi:MAG: 6-phosphofructokinase [Bacillota bacterium]|jgi:6-phosphofructokinase 1|nr:6-phosphofructokinase [Bacillota bacterium]MDD3297821.1 6-phosphofructokinase [Bacillota bacterium]MDD3850812.1 6-phosphofructokinase [Bacillota bacterium]MDD4707506.1 6-phosphofructokinase [Bacillota bacterium]